MVYGLRGFAEKYSESVRKFSWRIQFHSTSGYRELRKFFNNNLPTVRTLQRWLTSIDASPGITQVALDVISERAASYKTRGEKLNVCLISDGMSIRQQVFYNEKNMSFDGFSQTPNTNQEHGGRRKKKDKVPILKEASVYMVVGPDFRISIAYQLIHGLAAIDQAIFTKEVIRRIELTGTNIISLTGDGLHANMAVAKWLGADFENNKTFFKSPSNPNHNIYIIFDPPHMFKLLRKYLSLQQLQYGVKKIDWEMLKKLATKQDRDNFSITNKLSRNHIVWENHKMNVKKAVQIFSNENADALEQLCEDLYEDFIGCEKLVEFLRYGNDIFDVMNFAKESKMDKNFKQPICPSTIENITRLFNSFKLFAQNMTMEIKRKTITKRVPVKTQIGFLGLLISMESMIGIYKEYYEKSSSPVFYPFQTCQDHLEQFFSLVRGCLGANHNPTVAQFEKAYRKLLFCTPSLSKEVQTNCNVDFPHELLHASSDIVRTGVQNWTQINKILGSPEIEIQIDPYELVDIQINEYDRHVYSLAAYAVENEIIKRHQKQTVAGCNNCLNAFAENLKIFDSLISKKIKRGEFSNQPCSSTLQIILACEKINASLSQATENIDYACLAKTIFNNVRYFSESLYELTQFELHNSNNTVANSQITHKEAFILDVVRTFMNMQSRNICKKISIEEQAESHKQRMARRSRIVAGK